MSLTVYRFFQIAIWTPAALLVSLPLLEFMLRGPQGLDDILLTYGLSFGIIAYPAFAIWATRYIKKKSETAIARLIWWAPIIFIPFYGVPWVIYGLAHVVMGDMSGIAMTLSWIAFLPYIFVGGYVFAAVSFVIYEMFFRTINSEHEPMPETPKSIVHLTRDAKLFSNRLGHKDSVKGVENFSSYPRKIFLGQQGLFAYHATLMITDSEFEDFCELVRKMFAQATIKQGIEANYSSGDGSTLQLSVRQEFNGLIIELITNSRTLLEELDTFFNAPPPPWFAFPMMEPIEAAMAKQGSLQYWWEFIWSPFWDYAPIEIRAAYLRDHKASHEWAECLAGQATGTD
ncbi:hypothetical protein ACX0MV_01570 [Pseudomonas borbori]